MSIAIRNFLPQQRVTQLVGRKEVDLRPRELLVNSGDIRACREYCVEQDALDLALVLVTFDEQIDRAVGPAEAEMVL